MTVILPFSNYKLLSSKSISEIKLSIFNYCSSLLQYFTVSYERLCYSETFQHVESVLLLRMQLWCLKKEQICRLETLSKLLFFSKQPLKLTVKVKPTFYLYLNSKYI